MQRRGRRSFWLEVGTARRGRGQAGENGRGGRKGVELRARYCEKLIEILVVVVAMPTVAAMCVCVMSVLGLYG